ncbi:hypothetical protein [Glutamicibacter sp. NPDC087344]|uniref:hypothetical protein n=1 Tax=Glutamicibacter sp. NPDC087344 TaxID=3363994 RepID=UPI003804091B
MSTQAVRSSAGRWRSVFSALLIVIAVILAPVAVLGTWIHAQLTDTESFVATIAPLTEEPSVQEYISEEVVVAINEQIDIDELIGQAFDGIANLDLPPEASTAIGLLEGPAASGAHNIIASTVANVVASSQFSTVIEETLRQTHSRAIAIIQQQPGSLVTLTDDGTVSIQLGIIVERVKSQLQANGFALADSIPAIDKSIPLASDTSLGTIRTIYNLSVVGGYWLTWVVLALAAVGVVLARVRTRALARTGLGFGLVMSATWLGVAIGESLFVGTMAPGTMPAAAALAIYSQLTATVVSALAAMAVLSFGLALGTWYTGQSRSGRGTREMLSGGFAKLRRYAAQHGITTGAFGRLVERLRLTILVAITVVVLLCIFMNRPSTFSSVSGAIVWFIVGAILVELLRNPGDLDDHRQTAKSNNPQPAAAGVDGQGKE